MISNCGLCALATTLRGLHLDESATVSQFHQQYPAGMWPEELEAELLRHGGRLVLRKRCSDSATLDAVLKGRTAVEDGIIIEYFADGGSSHIYTVAISEQGPVIYDVQAQRGRWAPDKLSSFLVYMWANPADMKGAAC